MHFFSLLIPAALASMAVANPMETERSLAARSTEPQKCISYAVADGLVHDYIKLRTTGLSIGAKMALAGQILSDSYQDISDSVDWLSGSPFGTASTKQQFISGIPYIPTVPSIATSDVFHLCTKVLWRWKFNMTPYPVRGMNVFEVDPVSQQIVTNYVEFNSAVWMYDIGYTSCKPNATSYTPGPPSGAAGGPPAGGAPAGAASPTSSAATASSSAP